MNNIKFMGLSSLVVLGSVFSASEQSQVHAAQAENKASLSGDFRLRYEGVSQNNALRDAEALTLRSRLSVKTKQLSGWSITLEGENVVALVDDYSVPPTGDRVGQFSVVADPETTEIDQAFIEYQGENLSAKLGRQVITLDGHRFVGHVGWRQDKQTFDAVSLQWAPSAGLNLQAMYIDKRNRIFADEADIDSQDVLMNLAYQTPVGQLTAYSYLLDSDDSGNQIDTYGASLSGVKKIENSKWLYRAELATQERNTDIDTVYVNLEAGLGNDFITAKLGYERLGSDDGLGGFVTPLATLHKFNGWADLFLATPKQGLEDVYFSLSGKVFAGNWLFTYHDYKADVTLTSESNLGNELNLQYTRKFGDHFYAGLKFADYSSGDASLGQVDTEKLWAWLGYKL